MAGLLKYFKRCYDMQKKDAGTLPDPDGSLCRDIPSSSIGIANTHVHQVQQKSSSNRLRGPYISLTPAQMFSVGKRAAENGVTVTLRYCSKTFPDLALKETTVRRFKGNYLLHINNSTGPTDLQELPCKKRGRPLLIGEELDEQVKQYITYLRKEGAVVNVHVVMAVGEGIVMGRDANLLACNGESIVLTKEWVNYVLQRMGMVKCRANTKTKVTVKDFDELKKLFLLDIRNIVQMDEVPAQLIINWDQTGINYVPVSSWTMEQVGSNRIEIIGKDDKRQLTAVFGCSMAGDFLPPQLVYQGKTNRCLPQYKFPAGWDITFTENHWSNEETTHRYIINILLPYLDQIKKELKLDADHRALLIFDNFKGQCTENTLTFLDSNNVNVVLIPPKCTDRLQPIDLSVNKAAKEFLRRKFQAWYAQNVCVQLEEKMSKKPIDL